ncbi:MAG: ABC transporter permease [Cyclobacteriaceae bacterium]
MNVSFFFARRYFLSKRKKNFINIISGLSMTGVAFATAALIVVLSVFNGIGALLRTLYTAFDPPLKVVATTGKSFEYTDSIRNQILSINGIGIVTEVIEDHVYARNRTGNTEPEMVVTMKAVSDNFSAHHRIDDHIISGSFKLKEGATPCAVVGAGVRNTLSVTVENNVIPLQLFYVRNPQAGFQNPSELYASRSVLPSGVFAIEKNFDENYIIVPLSVGEELLDYQNRRTSLEIKPQTAIPEARSELQRVLGSDFRVLADDEQHKDLYRLLRIEKVFTFLALALLVIIASINIYFSLMMLVIEKRKDIGVLKSIGASPALIRNIFMSESFLISGIGTMAGLIGGAALCYVQQTAGLVGMGMENAVVSSYPVRMIMSDFLLVISLNFVITLLISWYPARAASRT